MSNVFPIEALGDPTRRQIVERLRQGPCSVGELVSCVNVSQPAVSQHLRVLKDARLVKVQKKGQQRIYRINPDGLAELRAYVETLWDGVLESFQEAAQELAQEESGNDG
jgi:DNA-binding transcriptional ArsR family regulator